MTATSKAKRGQRVQLQNIAFRGASGLAPENTLRACDMALRKGATVVDVNVRLSADGYPVLFHDEEVSRKTNGRGPIAKLKLKDIRKLRISGGRGRRVYEEPVSTLEEAILLTRGRGDLALELMGEEDTHPGIVETVIALIKKYELPDSTTVLTSSSRMLRDLRSFRPTFRLGRVLGVRDGFQKATEAIRERPNVLMLHRGAASPKVLAQCREARVKCWIYTIEHQKEFQRALSLRPEGVMPAHPGRIRRLMEREASGAS